MRVRAWPVVFLVGVMILESPAAAPETVAGRSLAEWTAELASTSRTRRLRAALTLPSFGPVAVKPLAKALEHDDPGVIYWAASGLGDLAHKSTRTRTNYERLRVLVKHKSIGLRLSAAYALSRIGETGRGSSCWPRGSNILIAVWPVRRPTSWLASGHRRPAQSRPSWWRPGTRTTTSREQPTRH